MHLIKEEQVNGTAEILRLHAIFLLTVKGERENNERTCA